MARLPAKKASRAETVQQAKEAAAANVIGIPAATPLDPTGNEGFASPLLEDAIEKIRKLDSHVLIWPHDFIRIGRLLASLYVSILVPKNLRVKGRRVYDLDSPALVLQNLEKTLGLGLGAFVTAKFPKILAWLLSAVKKGTIGLEEFQELVRAVRFITPLTGKVYTDELLTIISRAQDVFVPTVLALGKVLIRTNNPKRFRKEKVYGRKPVHLSKKQEPEFDFKDLLEPLFKK